MGEKVKASLSFSLEFVDNNKIQNFAHLFIYFNFD